MPKDTTSRNGREELHALANGATRVVQELEKRGHLGGSAKKHRGTKEFIRRMGECAAFDLEAMEALRANDGARELALAVDSVLSSYAALAECWAGLAVAAESLERNCDASTSAAKLAKVLRSFSLPMIRKARSQATSVIGHVSGDLEKRLSLREQTMLGLSSVQRLRDRGEIETILFASGVPDSVTYLLTSESSEKKSGEGSKIVRQRRNTREKSRMSKVWRAIFDDALETPD